MDIYEAESKGIRASGYPKGEKFIILEGSQAVNDAQVKSSLAAKPGRVIKRNELSSKNVLISLCPTCHRIAHMMESIYTVDEISRLVLQYKKG